MGSDLPTSGSVPLYLFDRYEEEAHRRATAENDFVVLKKVRVAVSCFTGIPSTHHAQSPVLGWDGVGWESLTQHMASGCPQGTPREMGHLCRHRDPRTRSDGWTI